MRLLNSSTCQLEEFFADRIPRYAILSHTWEEDEVLFTDMERRSVEGKAGYKKIRYSCDQAKKHGLGYIWVDTCCIDKRSSAELSEAINSMYSWYQEAEVCYAYLADVPATVNATANNSAFAESKWFTRGWTLQELLAPSNVLFFSGDWIEVGEKSTLDDIISCITGIDMCYLTGEESLELASVATRMSWASRRVTTRVEDIAYCLMGLFAVNMPMLYREGKRAFIRLQEEIMKNSDDQSLFAWTDSTAHLGSYHELLAESPAHFIDSGGIAPCRAAGAPHSMSNKGLCIDLHFASEEKKDVYRAVLGCLKPPHHNNVGIYLRRLSPGGNQYTRVESQTLLSISDKWLPSIETVYVRQSTLFPGLPNIHRHHIVQLREGPTQENGYSLIAVAPCDNMSLPSLLDRPKWVPTGFPFTFRMSKRTNEVAGALIFKHRGGERLLIRFGSTADFKVVFEAATVSKSESLRELKRRFIQRPQGNYMPLKNHRVSTDVDIHIKGDVKYYIVDITAEANHHVTIVSNPWAAKSTL